MYSGNIDSAENDSKLQTEAIIVIHDCIHVQVFGVIMVVYKIVSTVSYLHCRVHRILSQQIVAVSWDN